MQLNIGIGWCRAALTCSLVLAALHLGASSTLATKEYEDDKCKRGNYLCDHDKFHPIYQLLELLTGKSCCHKSEGRPTFNIMDATQEQVAKGFRYQAFVDGQWCPFKSEALMSVPDNQREAFMRYKRVNPELFWSFLQFDHAFASKSQPGPDGKLQCPTIHCVYAGFKS